ncbi:MAG: hypothetical protein K8S16_14615 [Bacteroidales bacterium]|nr:hypothetical protein [Bacteroidales bacterium]
MENNTVNEPLEQYGKPASFEQVWQMFQETDKMFKETDKKLNKLEAPFTSQWGKLIESLVEGDLVNVLNQRNIKVEHTMQRMKGNHKGEKFEHDIIAVNVKEVVIVEVKTTLRVEDVNYLHEKLWKAKQYMAEYKDKTIYGAVAFLTADGASDRMAEKMGLFVIKATGNSSSIINNSDFKPKAF